MLSWTYLGIKYVIFNPTDETINSLTDKNAEILAVGRAGINTWQGETTYQFIVADFNVLCYNKEKDFKF